MRIQYLIATDILQKLYDMIDKLDLDYIDKSKITCVRSTSSKSTKVIARIHGLPRIWQMILKVPPSYIIEIIDKQFNQLSEIERDRILIHELLHIPASFQGGYRTHNPWVTKKRVEQMHRKYQELKN